MLIHSHQYFDSDLLFFVFQLLFIIMFSSLMSEDNRTKAFGLGANETITKQEIGKMVGLMDEHVFKS